MDVVKTAVNKMNPGQVSVVTFDQPLYAIAKQVQWNWPNTHSENLFVVMLGGLHTEMAAFKVAGDWLQGSGWTRALVQAEIATTGTADAFLRASHVGRTKHAHQVTAAALHILQHKAYDTYKSKVTAGNQESLDFEAWYNQQLLKCPQFQYWMITLNLELCVLMFTCSQRESNFTLYLDTLSELVGWFFATHYARWLPVQETWLILQRHTQMLQPSLMLVTSQPRRQDVHSQPWHLIKRMSKTMPMSKVMEVLLDLLKTQVLFDAG